MRKFKFKVGDRVRVISILGGETEYMNKEGVVRDESEIPYVSFDDQSLNFPADVYPMYQSQLEKVEQRLLPKFASSLQDWFMYVFG